MIPSPTLQVFGSQLLHRGRPTKLWGIRTASATWTDRQTEQLIEQFDQYQEYGINAVTVFYMGCRGANYDPFSPDGRQIDAGHQRRIERIIESAATRRMIVIVGLFYQRAPFGLRDAAAVRQAARTATMLLRQYDNILINVVNEHNSPVWKQRREIFDFNDPRSVLELCRVVHDADPQRLVGGGGYRPPNNIVIGLDLETDVLLFDTAGYVDSGPMCDQYRDAGIEKPMVNVETFGGCTAKLPKGVFSQEVRRAYLREVNSASARTGLSVFFHNNPWCQQLPMRYDAGGQGTAEDPGIRWYFEHVRHAVAPAALGVEVEPAAAK